MEIERRIHLITKSPPKSTFVDLVHLAELDPRKHFQHMDLRGVDFSGCDLGGFDFEGSDLTGANFENANINGARLAFAKYLLRDLSIADDWDLFKDRMQIWMPKEMDPNAERKKRYFVNYFNNVLEDFSVLEDAAVVEEWNRNHRWWNDSLIEPSMSDVAEILNYFRAALEGLPVYLARAITKWLISSVEKSPENLDISLDTLMGLSDSVLLKNMLEAFPQAEIIEVSSERK